MILFIKSSRLGKLNYALWECISECGKTIKKEMIITKKQKIGYL